VTLQVLQNRPALADLPATVARYYAEQGSLEIVPLELSANHYPVGIIYRRDQEGTSPIKQIIQLIRATNNDREVFRPGM